MKTIIKKFLFNLFSRFISVKQPVEGEIFVLVYEPVARRAGILQKVYEQTLAANFPLKLHICRNVYEFVKLSSYANAIFCYNLSEKARLNPEKLKFIYFGVAGFNLPDSFQSGHYRVFSPAGIASKTIAEFTLLSALSLIHNHHAAIMNQTKKSWDQTPFITRSCASLVTKVVGIYGVGNNGKAIASVFKRYGCKTVGCNPTPDYSSSDIDYWYLPSQLDEFLASCDILIISAPLTEATRFSLNYEKLQRMKSGGYLINTSRGDIVVENDLVRALKNGTIAGAALDVFHLEPLASSNPLWKLKNVIITPHIFGNINYFTEQIYSDFLTRIKTEFPEEEKI